MMLHIDGSKHRWLQGDRWHDLIVILDDATSEIYYAQLVEEESTRTVMAACAKSSRLLKRLRTHGLVKKVGHTYKYYVTAFGKEVVATALKLRKLVVIPQLSFGSAQ